MYGLYKKINKIKLLYLMAHKTHLFSKTKPQEMSLHPMRPRFSIEAVVGGKSMATEALNQTPDIFAHVNKVMISTIPQNNFFFQGNNI